MRRWTFSLAMGCALAACLAIGVTGSARAATLDFTGTLSLQVPIPGLAPLVIPGGGSAQVTDDGAFHLLSLSLLQSVFGPVTVSLTEELSPSVNSVIFTGVGNLSGSFSGLSGGPPGGGTMGLSGLAKLCMMFASCQFAHVTLPLTPTTGGAVGFGIGGWQVSPGAVGVTMLHAPWTIGQPVMTFHSVNTSISTPALPGGFAHGPASLTSSTAQPSGALQLVTVSKVLTSLFSYGTFPVTGVLNLQFVPEPGTLLLLGSAVAVLAVYGRRRR
jgi:hypothetical protein